MEAAGKETLPILDHPLGGTIAVTPTGESAESSMGVVGPNREAAPAYNFGRQATFEAKNQKNVLTETYEPRISGKNCPLDSFRVLNKHPNNATEKIDAANLFDTGRYFRFKQKVLCSYKTLVLRAEREREGQFAKRKHLVMPPYCRAFWYTIAVFVKRFTFLGSA